MGGAGVWVGVLWRDWIRAEYGGDGEVDFALRETGRRWVSQGSQVCFKLVWLRGKIAVARMEVG